MTLEEMLNSMLVRTKTSKSKIANELGISLASVCGKIQRGKMPVDEIKRIAKIAGCEFRYEIVLPDGKTIKSED